MSKVLNTLLCALIAFLLCFLWIVYSLKDVQTAALLATIVALCCGYLVYRAEKVRFRRQNLKRNKVKQTQRLKETLRYGTDNAALFEQMLLYYRFAVNKIDRDSLVAQKNGQSSYVALCFEGESVSQTELVHAAVAALRHSCDRLLIFGCKADNALLKNAAKHINVQFVDIANTHELLEKASKLPPLVQKTHPMSPILPNMFCRKRFGLYFATSLFMLAMAVVSFLPWYALAWATVNFGLALYSLLNKRFNSQPTQITLD